MPANFFDGVAQEPDAPATRRPRKPYAVIDTPDAARRRLYHAAAAVVAAPQPKLQDTLGRRSRQIGYLIAAGLLGEQEGVQALYGAARQAGLPHREARATIVSGINSGIRRGANA